MRYFAYMADHSFRTDADDNIQFFLHGLFSRPHIVRNAEEKQRLHAKLTWFYRVYLSCLIVGMPLLFHFLGMSPLVFFSVLIGGVALAYIVLWILFRNDLCSTRRSDNRIRLGRFYAGMAAQNSLTQLALGFTGSLLFVGAGSFMLHQGMSLAIAITGILFFGLCAVAWGYALIIKIKTKPGPPAGAGDTDAAATGEGEEFAENSPQKPCSH